MEVKGRHISTKAIGAVSGVSAILVDGWADLGLTNWQMGCATALACAYIIGQGLKDFGKEAEKIKKTTP